MINLEKESLQTIICLGFYFIFKKKKRIVNKVISKYFIEKYYDVINLKEMANLILFTRDFIMLEYKESLKFTELFPFGVPSINMLYLLTRIPNFWINEMNVIKLYQIYIYITYKWNEYHKNISNISIYI